MFYVVLGIVTFNTSPIKLQQTNEFKYTTSLLIPIFQLLVSYAIKLYKVNPLFPETYSLLLSNCKTVATAGIWASQNWGGASF